MGMNVNPALDKTGEILRAIVAGGADAVLVSYGIAVKYADVLQDVGVIVRCDGGYSAIPSSASGHLRFWWRTVSGWERENEVGQWSVRAGR